MPIRISRVLACGLVAAASCFVVACGPAVPVRQEPAGAEVALSAEQALAGADSALARGDFVGAAKLYREAAQASDDEAVAEQATRAAFDHGQLQEASRAAERWLQINPTSENARRFAGITALKLHRLDLAQAHFTQLLDTVYVSPAAGYLALAPVVNGEAVPADVMELFRRLSAGHPDIAEGYYAYGSAALRADNFAAALAAAQAAVAKAPYWRPAKMLLARTQIATGDEEAGLALAKELVTDPQSDVAMHLEYAMLLAATGRDEEARAMLTPYTSGQTVIPGAVRTLGIMELDAGDLDAATAQFETLLATGAQSYDALFYMGNIAERRKDPDRAVRYYDRVASGDYGLAAQQRVARIKADKGGVQAGLAYLDGLQRAQPQLASDLYAAKAALLAGAGDDKRALQMYDEGIAS
ncbi:MAG: tetratricopeptide repeat protein, partial [Steroidobacteraceae bacterium]